MTAAQPPLPYGRQTIEDDDIEAVVAALRSPWLTCGPLVERFESAFAATVGAADAVVCSNGTAALHLACLTLDLAPRDAVIVPAITFVATAHAARYCGAEVVFADVDPDTGLMTVDTLTDAVARATSRGLRPRAVLPVHLAGQVCDMPELARAAHALGIVLIEDACHAVGSYYSGAEDAWLPVGSCRDSRMTVFSFHPVKTMTMGEGGIITVADPRLARRLRGLRTHGVVREAETFENGDLARSSDGIQNPWYVEYHEIGFNYRASEIQCALGLSQLRKLDRFVTARRGLVSYYRERLSGLSPAVRASGRARGCRPAWHLAVALIDFAGAGVSRAQLIRRLAACGVGSQVHYIPVHHQPCYRRRYGTLALPGAEAWYARCLSLPLFPDMATRDVDRVTETLAACLRAEVGS